jgi:hypothetical protein
MDLWITESSTVLILSLRGMKADEEDITGA